jgi:hypothetical protein
MKLDKFVSAYLECALGSSTDLDGRPLDDDFDIDDLAAETIAEAVTECRDFRDANADDLAEAGDDAQNGHDFWLTRNRHGAGFWDRGYGNVGKRLTDAAHVYGSVDLLPCDDGMIRS